MLNRRHLITSGTAALALAATPLRAQSSDISGDIRWASATLGSTGQVLLTGVTTIVGQVLPNVRMSVMTTSGSVENPRLLAAGETEFAAINADSAFPAAQGTAPYDQPIEMQTLFTTFGNAVVFLVPSDSDIQSMEDLRGRRVSVGPPNSGGYTLARAVLEQGYDMWGEIEPIYLGYGEQGGAMQAGRVDAMMSHLSGGAPAPYLSEVDATMDVRVIGQSQEAMDRIKARQPFQSQSTLTADMLENLDEDVLAMTNYNVQYARPGVDPDLVYEILKAFYANADQLQRFHRLGNAVTMERALEGALIDIPVNAGAARLFKESGVWRDDLTVA